MSRELAAVDRAAGALEAELQRDDPRAPEVVLAELVEAALERLVTLLEVLAERSDIGETLRPLGEAYRELRSGRGPPSGGGMTRRENDVQNPRRRGIRPSGERRARRSGWHGRGDHRAHHCCVRHARRVGAVGRAKAATPTADLPAVASAAGDSWIASIVQTTLDGGPLLAGVIAVAVLVVLVVLTAWWAWSRAGPGRTAAVLPSLSGAAWPRRWAGRRPGPLSWPRWVGCSSSPRTGRWCAASRPADGGGWCWWRYWAGCSVRRPPAWAGSARPMQRCVHRCRDHGCAHGRRRRECRRTCVHVGPGRPGPDGRLDDRRIAG